MFVVESEKCTGCEACMQVCPFDAIIMVDGKAQIDQTKCRSCYKCLRYCPSGAIVVREEEPIPVQSGKVARPEADLASQVPNRNQNPTFLDSLLDFFKEALSDTAVQRGAPPPRGQRGMGRGAGMGVGMRRGLRMRGMGRGRRGRW